MAKKNPFVAGWKDKTKAGLKKYFGIKLNKKSKEKALKF